MAKGNKKFNNAFTKWLAPYLADEMPDPRVQALYDTYGGRRNVNVGDVDDNSVAYTLNDYGGYLREGIDPQKDRIFPESFTPESRQALQANVDKNAALQDVSGGVTIPQLSKMLLGAAREHPFKTMGIGALGLGNVGGLMDNDKFGGQLGGLALGGLGSYYGGLNPGSAALLTLGGGQLGALFDKLRAKREGQRKQITQQQQARK